MDERTPTYTIYSIRGDGDQARWTRIGAGWRHRDGKGFSLAVEAMPLGGRLVVQDALLKQPAETGQEGAR